MSEIEPFAIIRGQYLIVGGEPVAYADAPFERIGMNESMKRINVAFEKAVSMRAKNAQKKYRAPIRGKNERA